MRNWKDLGDGFSYAWDGEVVTVHHKHADGTRCAGACSNHQLVSLEPLHLEPSLIMPCGAHGWIRDGKWQSA